MLNLLVLPKGVAVGSLTPLETSVLELVSGAEAYSYDLHLENIALSHYAFRAAGSVGAKEAADWIASEFGSFGLEVRKEAFQFCSWDLRSKPRLVIDEDGSPSTTNDQYTIGSFRCQHYSWPGDVFADLVVLPLPPAANLGEVGGTPIGTLWDAIDTTGKVVLVDRMVRAAGWEETFNTKLRAQPPVAVIFTHTYSWLASVPDWFPSAGGKPVPLAYFWDLGIPSGFVNYEDGLFIRNKESIVNVSAKVFIDSIVDAGPHYNVVGKLTGYGEPGKSVIVSGHYDTVMCAGFGDNGGGTSGVIELAHVLTEAVKRGLWYPKYNILFIAFAGEEIGLVGSINYVAQHKAELQNLMAVINLDCIGSDTLTVSSTELDHGIDLDQILLNAAGDIGVSASLVPGGQSDEWPFFSPSDMDNVLMWWWGTSLGIDGAHPVKASSSLVGFPLRWSETPPGWIHTSYDNSSSTGTLNWIEVDDLEDHIKVAALSLMRVSPSCSYASIETATRTGMATIVSSFGTLQDLAVVDESTLPLAGKPDLVFPHGFFSFTIVGLTPGQMVTIIITLPSNMPVGSQYWKWQTGKGWYQIPIGDDDGDNIITITLTDGGLGDSDGVNGIIIDPGGPGTPIPVGGVWVPINKFELLAPWIGLVSLMTIAMASVIYVKHRKKQQN
jgi:hypothetical protein